MLSFDHASSCDDMQRDAMMNDEPAGVAQLVERQLPKPSERAKQFCLRPYSLNF